MSLLENVDEIRLTNKNVWKNISKLSKVFDMKRIELEVRGRDKNTTSKTYKTGSATWVAQW